MGVDLTCPAGERCAAQTALRNAPIGSHAVRWMARLRLATPVLLTLCALATHAREPLADGTVQWFDTKLVGGRILPARDLERKVVLQYFWATWCPICRSDLPHLQKLYETYRSRGLEIVAQSLDDDEQSVQMLWQERGYTFPVAMRSEETRERFGPIRGTPTLFLVDRGGVIRLKRLGRLADGELESRIIALLER